MEQRKAESDGITEGRAGGRFCAEDSEFPEEGRAESGNGEGEKFGTSLMHRHDYNASGKKAVTPEVFASLRCLKSFVLL